MKMFYKHMTTMYTYTFGSCKKEISGPFYTLKLKMICDSNYKFMKVFPV